MITARSPRLWTMALVLTAVLWGGPAGAKYHTDPGATVGDYHFRAVEVEKTPSRQYDGVVIEVSRREIKYFTGPVMTWGDLSPQGLYAGEGKEMARITPGTDVTGDGRPNVVGQAYTGGAHCCYLYFIFDAGDAFRVINVFETWDSLIQFRDLDGKPGLEIELWDKTYRYWPLDYASSPAPRVVLKYKDGFYQPAPELMRKLPLTPAALNDLAAMGPWFGTEGGWPVKGEPKPGLFHTLLDMIYSGNLDQAMAFFDKVWPTDAKDKDKWGDVFFCNKLKGSPYWPAVAKMNDVPKDHCPWRLRQRFGGAKK